MDPEGFHRESWIESVVAGARNPHSWLDTAESLKRGSDLLREVWLRELTEMPVRSAAYMTGQVDKAFEPWVGHCSMTLAGFAIENLLKGLVIAADPTVIQPSADNPNELLRGSSILTHELLDLARLAEAELSADETALFTKLTEFVRWAGRYPFPTRALDHAPRPGAEQGGASFTSAAFPVLDALFERLRERLFAAGAEADRRGEEASAEEKRHKRAELLAALASLRRVELQPGVVAFETGLPSEAGTALVCTRCGASADLNPQRPACVCRCGTLYFGEVRGVAGRFQFTVDSYPAE